MTLNQLGFTKENGLVSCSHIEDALNNTERLYLHEVLKLKGDAVFFRRFYNTSAETPYKSEPAVCIFNRNESFFDTEENVILHSKLWSAGRNEIYVIKTPTRLQIVNARRPAKADENGNLSLADLHLADLHLANEALESFDHYRFSAPLFQSGTFWEQEKTKNKLEEGHNPHVYLVNFLMLARKKILEDTNLTLASPTVDKLIILCILIKFLEEMRDENEKNTLDDIYKRYGIENFAEAIEVGKSIDILDELGLEFNGKIFNTLTEEEKIEAKKTNLTPLSKFLEADIDIGNNQKFIWKQYSFKYLPPEVISAIYENFIQADSINDDGKTEKGIVYTPLHLVNLLVDEAMPLDKPELFAKNSFKVLDPTCGSGVFLVAAYKRLIQWWIINNSNLADGIKYPSKTIAKNILEENIFGVDVKKSAVLVSIFSLTTSFLEKLTPQEIWNNLKFKDLSERNVIHTDNFFTWAIEQKEQGNRFDLVIGNPPFNPEKGKKKNEIVNKDIIQELDFKHKTIPNNNFALHFFEGSMCLSDKVCMIIPSNGLLYNPKSQKYRTELFTDYSVSKIYDFTHLRRILFHKTADTPVVALVAENKPSQKESIQHIVVKRMATVEKKLRFEIDYYDTHSVRWDWAVDEAKSFIWKTNLLGGGRLFQLIYRLSLLDDLKYYISNVNGSDLIKSRGYERGGTFYQNNESEILGISPDGEVIIETTSFKYSKLKARELYKPPFIVIDQVLGDSSLLVSLVNNREQDLIYYSKDFVGISSTSQKSADLEKIYSLLKNHSTNTLNYQLYILSISSSCLISTETDINLSEIFRIPYPNDLKYLSLSESESLVQEDTLSYYRHLGKSISKNSAGYILEQNVEQQELQDFGAIFCQELNGIYENDSDSWQVGKVIETSNFIAYQFGFGLKDEMKGDYLHESSDESIVNLLKDNLTNEGVSFNRITRYYNHQNGFDCLLLVKPKSRRYWLKSIALRDADDTFMDLKEAGY
jgi:type I restriction-modification system DNA methylase subunit